MEKKILIYIFTFQLTMTNCNFNNNDKNSSAMVIKNTQKDSKKKNSEKTNIIKEIEKRGIDNLKPKLYEALL